MTLYESRGDQIERYGFAASGLTVAPYLVMSIINLASTMLTPEYPTAFVVDSEIMREAARRDDAQFSGMVGVLKGNSSVKKGTDVIPEVDQQGHLTIRLQHPPSPSTAHKESNDLIEKANEVSMSPNRGSLPDTQIVLVPPTYPDSMLPSSSQYSLPLAASMCVGLIAVAINGGLTHFRKGQSTHAQRIWTMTWLVLGIAYNKDDPDIIPGWRMRYMLLKRALHCAPAIGGFVVVSQMLMDYGRCIRV